jgi:lysyl endopeptidase
MKQNLLSVVCAAAMLLGAAKTNAQIVHEEGVPFSWSAQKAQADVPTAKMPGFDLAAVQAEDAFNEASKMGPWRFAIPHMVNYNILNSGEWEDLKGGDRIWRMAFSSPDAMTLNIIFDEYDLPEGAKLWIYNADRTDMIGPFTAENNKDWGTLATTPVRGDFITVEYFEPAEVAGQGSLSVGQVSHGYRDIFGYGRRIAEKGLGDSGSCNNNVICPEGDDWRCQISSVAMIVVSGSGACTGTMINNSSNDGTPYFLTANHCGSSVTNWVFRYNWQSDVCGSNNNGPTNQTVSGATQLFASGGSDVSFLELSAAPPAAYDVFFTGYDASGVFPTNQVGIHHPSGDIKKISFDNDAAVHGTMSGAQCWQILTWEDGTTEPGSSGSGLWDQDKRLIGQLFGGQASCGNNVNDYYGRLDVSYAAGMNQWLGADVADGLGTGACAGTVFANDAAISAVDNVDPTYCNVSTINPSVVIKNFGTNTLTSATINWTFNGTSGSTPWTGSLATGATDNVAVGPLTVQAGANTLNVYTSAPNGATDENPANDDKDSDFTAVLNGTMIDVNIVQDQYGSETTWEITDGSGTVMASGGPYADGNDQVLETATACLEEGVCYDFTINDGFGDGICCAFGNGSYEVLNGSTVLASGGEFADAETTNFCVAVGVEENSMLQGIVVYPNPTNGIVNVDLSKLTADEVQISIFNAVGALVSTDRVSNIATFQSNMSNHPAGLYFVEVRTENGVSVQKLNLSK